MSEKSGTMESAVWDVLAFALSGAIGLIIGAVMFPGSTGWQIAFVVLAEGIAIAFAFPLPYRRWCASCGRGFWRYKTWKVHWETTGHMDIRRTH